MAVSLYSSHDFELATTDVNITPTLIAQKAFHDSRVLQVPFARVNTAFANVLYQVAGNARTIAGSLQTDFLSYISDKTNADISDAQGDANKRRMQDLFMSGIAMSLYARGATDSTAHKSIGTSQIVAGADVPIEAADAAGATTYSETLFQNCGVLVKEAVSQFNTSLNANKASADGAGNWLWNMLSDAHENQVSRAMTVALASEGADSDKFHLLTAAGDMIQLYFLMTSDTDDAILGTSRTDDQATYTNPVGAKIRLALDITCA